MALSKKEQAELEQIEAELASAPPPPAEQPAAQAAQPEQRSQLQALGSGVAQGVTLGFSDEIGAGMGAAVQGLSDTVANFASGKIELGEFQEIYNAQVEQARAINEQDEANFPKTFMAGEAGGALASTLIPGAPLARAGAGLKGAVALGAGMGGAAAAGKSEAGIIEQPKDLLGDIAAGALIGGSTGGVLQGAGQLLGAGVRKILPQKAKDIAANVIKPQAAAADLRNAAKASTKKTFSQEANKNLVKGVEGLQKRGVLPSERTTFQAMDKREMHKLVRKESEILGESIEKITKAADEAGVDFGSNQLGIKSIRETAKAIKKSSTSDEMTTAIGNVEELLSKDKFKATDLFGLKQELDGLIKTGTSLKSIKKTQMKNLMKVRTEIKEALEDKIDEAATRSPELRSTLDKHGTKNFAELNDAFGDTKVVRETLADAAALTEFEEGAALASPLSEQIGEMFRMEGLTSAITRGAGKVVGAGSEKAIRGGAALGGVVRKAAQAQQQSATIARALYNSMDEDNVLNDEADRKAHAGRVMSNRTLSHAQKFREVNMLQTSGKINPESIPAQDKRSTLKRLEEERKAEDELIRQQLGL